MSKGKSAHATVAIQSWGRQQAVGVETAGEDLARLTVGATLTRGLGRSYGDASLPASVDDTMVNARFANRVLQFDEATGRLRAEAGLCLADLNRLVMPRGWFVAVTPGTKFVTLGGMVASDVHGKNHHRKGCFCAHVQALRLRLAEGDVVECSRELHPELFHGTCGGMGLLGHILEVECQLDRIESPWIKMERERVSNIDAFLDALEEAALRWPMTMGWIDCLSRGRSLGRGVLMAGRWATGEEAKARHPGSPREWSFPSELPSGTVNRVTSRTFNAAYYRSHVAKHLRRIVAPDPFFYPLDAILEWNRAYGKRGFTQYQCVLPRCGDSVIVRSFLQLLASLGAASPLCVIKDCGPEGEGLLSFPMEGTSIAVDMPLTADTQGYVDRLNSFVIDAGGRIYLTKDLLTRPEHFWTMEAKRLPRFLAARDRWDPKRRLRSALSQRLFGAAT